MTIYFGNAHDKLFPDEYKNVSDNRALLAMPAYAPLKKIMNIHELIFAHQVHGIDGLVVTKDNIEALRPLYKDADFLITKIQAGLGVFTADCLPIVVYDSCAHAVGIVHAGWRGTVRGVLKHAIQAMQKELNVSTEHIKIFFGPSAKVCCYQVSDDFRQELGACTYKDDVLIQHNGSLYFDAPLYNRHVLEEMGIKKDAICLDYNICTICDHSFYSYRRQGQQAGRQMTVVSLK